VWSRALNKSAANSVQVLQETRQSLVNKYSQIPQLSCGGHYDLDQPIVVSFSSTRPTEYTSDTNFVASSDLGVQMDPSVTLKG
jgi:hypothetical protein